MEHWRSKCESWTSMVEGVPKNAIWTAVLQRHESTQHQPELATCNLLLNLQRADVPNQLLPQSEMKRPGTIDTDHLETRVRPQKNASVACSSSGSCIVLASTEQHSYVQYVYILYNHEVVKICCFHGNPQSDHVQYTTLQLRQVSWNQDRASY